MDKRAEKLESYMQTSFKKFSGLDNVLIDEVLDPIDMEKVKSLLLHPVEFNLTEEGLTAKLPDSGNIVNCTNFGVSIKADSDWLSSKLPSVEFDVDQEGDVKKAEEAQSLYLCLCVAIVMGEMFQEELLDLIPGYDFREMKPLTKTNSLGETVNVNLSYKELLKSWTDLQSHTISCAISAGKGKISELKKDADRFLNDCIEDHMSIALKTLEYEVASINAQYANGPLARDKVQKMKRIELLRLISEKDDEILSAVNSSDVSGLWQAKNLSTEFINPLVKKRIQKLAEDKVDEFLKSDSYSDVKNSFPFTDKEIDTLKKQYRRRYLKSARLSVRKESVLKYIADPEGWVKPPKL
jgi:uncharacterized protein YnzC (UPF0291/DUF896 family)